MNDCRICLKSVGDKDIFKLNVEMQGESKSFIEILLFCLDIVVTQECKVGTKLCLKCYKKILSFQKFKSLAQKNDAYLRSLNLNLDIKNEVFLIDNIKYEDSDHEFSNNNTETEDVKDERKYESIQSDDELLSVIKQIKYENTAEESKENESDDDANETEGNVCSKEYSENTQRNRLNSSSSSSSTSSTSFIEDSDDSVKDPPYQPPENQVPVSPIIFDESYDEHFRQSPVQSGLFITSDTNNVPGQENTENATEKRGKRKRDENNWKKNVLRKLRNEGKSYVSTSNKIVPERKIKNSCSEICKLKCSKKFTDAERKSIFHDYWALGNISKQWNYISNCMKAIVPKYRYVREGGNREKRRYNNAFYFNLHEKKVRVCKLFFKNTLGITDRPIRTVLEKQNKVAGNLLADDKRGKHKNHAKVDDAIRKGIKEHIDSIPRMESHYCRAYTSKEFIDDPIEKTVYTKKEKKKSKDNEKKDQICEECGKSVRNIKDHISRHQSISERKCIKCKVCDKLFSSYSARYRHHRVKHLGIKQHCDICNKDVTSLKVHHLVVHNTKELPYECVPCGRRFISQSTLDMHTTIHTKDRPHCCDQCDKKFRNKITMIQHKRQVHDKERSHLCQFCSKSFFKKYHLQIHLRSHTKEKPFQCSECKKWFSSRTSLKNHQLIHNDVKMFGCTQCDMTFSKPGYLRKHMISHTKEKRYSCKYCGARYGRSDHRKRHEFAAHERNHGLMLKK